MRKKQIIFFLILFQFILDRGYSQDHAYLICIFAKSSTADGYDDSTRYVFRTCFKIDSVDLNIAQKYCQTNRFIDYYSYYGFIDPDSLTTIELRPILYISFTNRSLYDSLNKEFDKRGYAKDKELIPEDFRMDTCIGIDMDYVIHIYKINNSESPLFLPDECIDINANRVGLRQRSKKKIWCPQFYFSLNDFKPEFVNMYFTHPSYYPHWW